MCVCVGFNAPGRRNLNGLERTDENQIKIIVLITSSFEIVKSSKYQMFGIYEL